MSLIPFEGAIEGAEAVITKFIPDKAQQDAAAAQFKLAVLEAQNANITGQLDTDKAEAANPNMFVAGWRPFIGWVCGAALVYQYLLLPLGTWALLLAGHAPVTPPTLDGSLWQLLTGMLGLGAMRSFEKYQGVQSNH